MNGPLPTSALQRGVSLVETMVAVGVLSVVGPLSIAALMKSGEGGTAARAETRSAVIVDQCLAELKQARDGISPYLPSLEPGKDFGTDEVVCLAFSRDGTLLGRVDGSIYGRGSDKVAGSDAVYFARLGGTLDSSRSGYPPLLTVTVSVEFPAAAPHDRRRNLDFHTKLP